MYLATSEIPSIVESYFLHRGEIRQQFIIGMTQEIICGAGFSLNEIITGSNLFEISRLNAGGTKADQKAIRNGYLLKGYRN